MIIGAFLIIEGVWGLFSEVVFGVLTTNFTHAIIHILLGITGLWLGYKNNARTYCVLLGILLLVVGILRFVPGASDLIVKLLNVNAAVAYVNIAIGAIALLVSYRAKLTYSAETEAMRG